MAWWLAKKSVQYCIVVIHTKLRYEMALIYLIYYSIFVFGPFCWTQWSIPYDKYLYIQRIQLYIRLIQIYSYRIAVAVAKCRKGGDFSGSIVDMCGDLSIFAFDAICSLLSFDRLRNVRMAIGQRNDNQSKGYSTIHVHTKYISDFPKCAVTQIFRW